MEPALAAAGALTTAAAAAGLLQARSVRMAVLGMGAVLVLSPLALPSLPPVLPLAFWMVTALLAAFLLLLAVRGTPDLLPPLPLGGWPEGAFVALGLVLGWAVAIVVGPGRGPSSAMAAGVAVAIAAVPLIAFSRDALRTAIGAVLVLDSAGLVAAALAGTPSQLEIVALGLAVAAAAEGSREIIVMDTRARASGGPAAWPDPRTPGPGGSDAPRDADPEGRADPHPDEDSPRETGRTRDAVPRRKPRPRQEPGARRDGDPRQDPADPGSDLAPAEQR